MSVAAAAAPSTRNLMSPLAGAWSGVNRSRSPDGGGGSGGAAGTGVDPVQPATTRTSRTSAAAGRLLARVDGIIDLALRPGARSIDLTSRTSRVAANRLYPQLDFQLRDSNVYRYQPRLPAP
jgi:hypothetical protein